MSGSTTEPMSELTGDAEAVPVPSWILRPVRASDIEAIARAELELFPDEAWSRDQLIEELLHPLRRYVVCVEEGAGVGIPPGDELLGYAGIMVAGDSADLHTIGTRRPGQGIGRALLAWCEQAARDLGARRLLLEVREDNARARDFYTAAGYREIAHRRGYYRIRGRAVDALIMERGLGAGAAGP